jgi:DNA-binding LacI/PurR family transcriptional regulator
VSDEVSVIGFDDTPVAALSTYGLTTLRQPINHMAEAAIRILFEKIEKRADEPEHVMLGAQLIERGSAKAR